MPSFFKPLRALAAAAPCLFLLARPAAAQDLIANGGFETGTFAGWSVVNRPLGAPYDAAPAAGNFFLNTADGDTVVSGLPALGPASGGFYALSDMTAQGTHALLQSFTVPVNAPFVSLSFDMFVYDWYGAGAAVSPAGLDHTTGDPNQHARVDLLTAGAGAFDTGAGSVLANFYLGVDPESAAGLAPVYRSYAFNLTGLALPGQTYQLRFGVVDNQFVINQGVDNVRVLAAVPEPGTWTLLLGAGGPLIWLARGSRARRRARRTGDANRPV